MMRVRRVQPEGWQATATAYREGDRAGEGGQGPTREGRRAARGLRCLLLSLRGQISPEPLLEGSPDRGESLDHRRTDGVRADVAISDPTEKEP